MFAQRRGAQHATGLRHHLAELLVREPCLRDDALAALEIELAGLGRLDLACRAVQETQPDRLFQAADPSGLADGAKHLSATSMAAIDNAAVSALRCFQTRDTQG